MIPPSTKPILVILSIALACLSRADEAPLNRYDPYESLPEGCLAVFGEQRFGFPSLINPYQSAQFARINKSDFWFFSGQEDRQIVMMKLDRELGECRVNSMIDAGGRWSLAEDASELFAARWNDDDKPTYSLFETKTNKRLWSFDSKDIVLASTFSFDQKFLLVMLQEANNAVSVVWLNRSSGAEVRRVMLPGTSKLYAIYFLGSVIADTKEGTFVCRNSEEGHPLFFIDKSNGEIRKLLSGNNEFGPRDNWRVLVQPGNSGNVIFYHSHMLYLFSNEAGKLTPIHQVQAGSESYTNDDIINVHFNDSGDRLVVGSLQQTMVIDMTKPDQILQRIDDGNATSDFTADDQFLVFWGRGGAWPYQTSNLTSVRDDRVKKEAFHCCPLEIISFSPKSDLVVTGDGHRLLLWTLDGKNPAAQLTSPRELEECELSSIAWGPEGKTLLGVDGYDVLEWNLGKALAASAASPMKGETAFGALKSRSARKMLEVGTDPGGRHAVVLDRKGATYYDLENPGTSRSLNIDPTDFGFRPREFYVNGDQELLVLKTTANTQLVSLTGDDDLVVNKDRLSESALRGKTGEVLFLEQAPDRKSAMLHSKKIVDGTITSSLKLDSNMISLRSIKVSADGSLLAIPVNNKTMLVEWESKKVLREISTKFWITAGAFSPDNQYFMAGATNRAAYLWKVRD